ncbi:protein kinase domain-containing protein [Nannocystaceae bacterium ST9]
MDRPAGLLQAAPVNLPPGLRERFRVSGTRVLGSSGFVCRAWDHLLEAEVALKVYDGLDPVALLRLKDEFRVRSGLAHPNLVDVYELLVVEGRGYLVMEWIDGIDFVTFARSKGVACLHELGAQLFRGLAALHALGITHRDIKPANVLVAEGPRVVIVDFGFAEGPQRVVADSPSAGTLAYLSPERLRGQAASPASDVYAAGLCLFEAAAGRPAFAGDPQDVILAKTLRRAPALWVAGLDSRVANAVEGSLVRASNERLGAEQLLELLELECVESVLLLPGAAPTVHGRERELDLLVRAWAEAARGETSCIEVVGEAGIGKSTLLSAFSDTCELEQGCLVLRGRCHPAAAVSHAMLDDIVDQLAAWIADQPSATRHELLPEHFGELARRFPTLGMLRGEHEWGLAGDPQVASERATLAFAELIARVRKQRRLLVWIDDAQWADADSVALTRAATERDEGAMGMLVVLTRRRDLEAPVGFTSLAPQRLELGPLSHDELARSLELAREEQSEAWLERCAGNPLLARLALRLSDPSTASFDLEHALEQRIHALPAAVERLFELLCVSEQPLARRVVLLLLAKSGTWQTLQDALHGGWIRVARSHGELAYEPFHQRVRELVLARLPPERALAHHQAIVEALSVGDAFDPVALLRHLLGAGRPDDAWQCAVRGAEQAVAALAFHRAAQLYGAALELGVHENAMHELSLRRGEALAAAGRGGEAAEAFLRAASSASEQEALELRARAGEQLLRCGRFEPGLALLREVLETHGESTPHTQLATLASVVLRRVSLALRGRSLFTAPPKVSLEDSTEPRMNALWRTSTALATLEPLLANTLATKHLLLSLRRPDLRRRLQAVGYEATIRASLAGPRARPDTDRLLAQVEQLAARSGAPYDLAWLDVCRGVVAYFDACFATVVEAMDAAERRFASECIGVDWELGQCRGFALTALAWQGRLAALAKRHRHALAWSDDRDDQFLASELRLGMPTLATLARGEAERVLDDAARILPRWPTQPFPLPRYLAVLSRCMAHLHAGQIDQAWQVVTVEWPALERAQYLRLPFPRAELSFLRARTALALPRSSSLDAAVRADLRRLGRSPMPNAGAFVHSLRSTIALREGRRDEAVSSLLAAAESYAKLGMLGHEAASRLRLAELGEGGEPAWFEEQRIREPQAFARAISLSF